MKSFVRCLMVGSLACLGLWVCTPSAHAARWVNVKVRPNRQVIETGRVGPLRTRTNRVVIRDNRTVIKSHVHGPFRHHRSRVVVPHW